MEVKHLKKSTWTKRSPIEKESVVWLGSEFKGQCGFRGSRVLVCPRVGAEKGSGRVGGESSREIERKRENDQESERWSDDNTVRRLGE